MKENRQVSYVVEPVPSTLNDYVDLEFEVEDEGVAEVSRLGVVHSKSPGTTKINVLRRNPDTYEPETVGVVNLTVTESEPDMPPTPDPDPLPKPDRYPAASAPELRSESDAHSERASRGTANGMRVTAPDKGKLPKTGDEVAVPPSVLLLLVVAGACALWTGLRLRSRNASHRAD